MRFLLLILVVFSPCAFAQKNIGRDSFMVNVRPVLSGIVSDFYQMVALFPEFPKDIVPLIEEVDSLNSDKDLLKTTCPRTVNLKCKEAIQSMRKKLVKIKSLSFILLSQQRMSQSLHLNSLSGLRIVNDFDLEMEEVKGYLDNASFLLSAGIPQKRETYFIIKELDELNTLLSLAVVEYIPFFYKEDFRHFFFNFIHPIQQQISKNNNHEFVNRNITSLNFTINLLNQTLTKKKKTPEGMGPYLATLHNRWNSILRFYF